MMSRDALHVLLEKTSTAEPAEKDGDVCRWKIDGVDITRRPLEGHAGMWVYDVHPPSQKGRVFIEADGDRFLFDWHAANGAPIVTGFGDPLHELQKLLSLDGAWEGSGKLEINHHRVTLEKLNKRTLRVRFKDTVGKVQGEVHLRPDGTFAEDPWDGRFKDFPINPYLVLETFIDNALEERIVRNNLGVLRRVEGPSGGLKGFVNFNRGQLGDSFHLEKDGFVMSGTAVNGVVSDVEIRVSGKSYKYWRKTNFYPDAKDTSSVKLLALPDDTVLAFDGENAYKTMVPGIGGHRLSVMAGINLREGVIRYRGADHTTVPAELKKISLQKVCPNSVWIDSVNISGTLESLARPIYGNRIFNITTHGKVYFEGQVDDDGALLNYKLSNFSGSYKQGRFRREDGPDVWEFRVFEDGSQLASIRQGETLSKAEVSTKGVSPIDVAPLLNHAQKHFPSFASGLEEKIKKGDTHSLSKACVAYEVGGLRFGSFFGDVSVDVPFEGYVIQAEKDLGLVRGHACVEIPDDVLQHLREGDELFHQEVESKLLGINAVRGFTRTKIHGREVIVVTLMREGFNDNLSAYIDVEAKNYFFNQEGNVGGLQGMFKRDGKRVYLKHMQRGLNSKGEVFHASAASVTWGSHSFQKVYKVDATGLQYMDMTLSKDADILEQTSAGGFSFDKGSQGLHAIDALLVSQSEEPEEMKTQDPNVEHGEKEEQPSSISVSEELSPFRNCWVLKSDEGKRRYIPTKLYPRCPEYDAHHVLGGQKIEHFVKKIVGVWLTRRGDETLEVSHEGEMWKISSGNPGYECKASLGNHYIEMSFSNERLERLVLDTSFAVGTWDVNRSHNLVLLDAHLEARFQVDEHALQRSDFCAGVEKSRQYIRGHDEWTRRLGILEEAKRACYKHIDGELLSKHPTVWTVSQNAGGKYTVRGILKTGGTFLAKFVWKGEFLVPHGQVSFFSTKECFNVEFRQGLRHGQWTWNRDDKTTVEESYILGIRHGIFSDTKTGQRNLYKWGYRSGGSRDTGVHEGGLLHSVRGPAFRDQWYVRGKRIQAADVQYKTDEDLEAMSYRDLLTWARHAAHTEILLKSSNRARFSSLFGDYIYKPDQNTVRTFGRDVSTWERGGKTIPDILHLWRGGEKYTLHIKPYGMESDTHAELAKWEGEHLRQTLVWRGDCQYMYDEHGEEERLVRSPSFDYYKVMRLVGSRAAGAAMQETISKTFRIRNPAMQRLMGLLMPFALSQATSRPGLAKFGEHAFEAQLLAAGFDACEFMASVLKKSPEVVRAVTDPDVRASLGTEDSEFLDLIDAISKAEGISLEPA